MIRRAGLVPALILAMMLGAQWGPAAQEQTKLKGPEEQKQPQDAPRAATAQNQQGPKKRNPFTGNAEAIAQGRMIWMQSGCNGCHGMGGGGMGPSVMDDAWKWGGDDETLFKLIKGQLPNQTMPAVFGAVLTEEQVWKVIAWVRSIYKGDADRIVW
jgi:cytochrome c(L)